MLGFGGGVHAVRALVFGFFMSSILEVLSKLIFSSQYNAIINTSCYGQGTLTYIST